MSEKSKENKGKKPEKPQPNQAENPQEKIVTANGLTENQWLMINGC